MRRLELLNSDGSVLSTNQFSTGFSPDPDNSTIVVADFNGDHKLDLAASNPATDGSGPGSVAILLGNGNGTFQTATSIQAGPNPASLAAADFNDDGKTDLAAASQSSAIISVLTGNGNGTFGTPVSYATGGDSQSIPSSILAVDLNNDGHPDLAVANRGYVSVANSSISALLNTGTSFHQSSVTPLPLPLLPDYLAAADLNHDRNLDLVAVSQNASGMIVLSGKGD
ncbi:MAG: VCBS repeat-containing protein, partial [Bryobacteraceae bacterium]